MNRRRRRFDLRRRLALLMLGVVAAFMVTGFGINAWLARSSLIDSVDRQLDARASLFRSLPPELESVVAQRIEADPVAREVRDLSEQVFRFQLLDSNGAFLDGDPGIPIDPTVVEDARTQGSRYRSVEIDGRDFRVLTEARADGAVMQAATPIESINDGLASLRTNSVVLGAICIALAGAAGWYLAGRFVRPITEVSAATARLAGNDTRPAPIAAERDDEIGDLVTSFNALIAALHASDEQRERLVADASHELRTPLTSLRMKIDFLDAEPDLDGVKRTEIVRGAAAELESLTELVDELVTLARHEDPDDPIVPRSLGDLTDGIAERFRTTTGRTIDVERDDTRCDVRERLVARAVANLVDNAVKFSPADARIEIRQLGTTIEVRDHGAGIAPADRQRAFDRFHRSPSAHDVDGSGIGLSIVRHAADEHGGSAWIDRAPGGGTIAGLSLSAPQSKGAANAS